MIAARYTLTIYTDGLKREVLFGARVYCRELAIKLLFKLPNHYSICQAVVFASEKAAKLAANASANNSTVNIYVDSQPAIKA